MPPGELVMSIESAEERREMEKQNQSVSRLVPAARPGNNVQEMLDAAEAVAVHGDDAVAESPG